MASDATPRPEPTTPPDLRGLVADPDFASLPVERQRALAARLDPDIGKLDAWAQDRLLTRLAPDPYAFTETRHGLPPGLLKAMHDLESSNGKNLVSATGVRGPFQITGRTGRAYGLPEDQWNDELAQLATAGNILRDNLKRAKGDIRAAVNLYADPKDRGWYADRLLSQLPGGAPAGTASAPTTTPTSFPDPLLGPGEPPRSLLATMGSRVTRDLGAVPQGVRSLGRFIASGGPQAVPDAIRALGILAPLNIPLDVALALPEHALVRAGVDREQARFITDLAGIPASLALPGGVAAARRLRPMTTQGRLRSAAIQRTGEEVASAAGLQQARAGHAAATTGDEIANAARLQQEVIGRAGYEIGEAGKLGRAQELGPRIVGAANRQTETLTKAGQRAQAAARRAAKPGVATPLRTLDEAPAPRFDPITGQLLPPRVAVPGSPAVPPARFDVPGRALPTAIAGGRPAIPPTTKAVPTARVGRGVLSPEARAAQRAANDESAQAVSHAQTTARLRNFSPTNPIAAVQAVSRDPDLAAALLRHATPEEATWIAEAVTVGRAGRPLGPVQVSETLPRSLPTGSTAPLPPLTALPPSGLVNRLSRAARIAALGGGFLAGGGGLAGVMKASVGYLGERAVEATLRKMLDVSLNSKAGSQLARGLMQLDPASREFTTVALRLAELSTRETPPRRIERR